jgi:hypothetical protein
MLLSYNCSALVDTLPPGNAKFFETFDCSVYLFFIAGKNTSYLLIDVKRWEG